MNFFGKRQQRSPQRGYEERRESPEEIEARIKQLEITLKAKQLENWFNQRCIKQCYKLDQDFLDDSETQCLDNCTTKFNKYFNVYKEVVQSQKKAEH